MAAEIDLEAVADALGRYKGGATVGMVWAVCKLEHLNPAAVQANLEVLVKSGRASRSGITYYPTKGEAKNRGN